MSLIPIEYNKYDTQSTVVLIFSVRHAWSSSHSITQFSFSKLGVVHAGNEHYIWILIYSETLLTDLRYTNSYWSKYVRAGIGAVASRARTQNLR